VRVAEDKGLVVSGSAALVAAVHAAGHSQGEKPRCTASTAARTNIAGSTVTSQQAHATAVHIAHRFADQPEVARELLDMLGLAGHLHPHVPPKGPR
jgi:hypothetical protein